MVQPPILGTAGYHRVPFGIVFPAHANAIGNSNNLPLERIIKRDMDGKRHIMIGTIGLAFGGQVSPVPLSRCRFGHGRKKWLDGLYDDWADGTAASQHLRVGW